MPESTGDTLLETLLAKEAIRELAQLYSRAIDRQDIALLRSLYTEDATDSHGDHYDGPVAGYCAFIESKLPILRYSGHHVCNHLIALAGDTAEGEVYAIAYHVLRDGAGGWVEDIRTVRYLDHYRKCDDGCWRFSKRVAKSDYGYSRPIEYEAEGPDDAAADPSYSVLTRRLFARGTNVARGANVAPG